MRLQRIFVLFYIALMAISISCLETSCANIGMPTGGPRDSAAPILVQARPELNAVNVSTDRITFIFDEYVEIQNAQTAVIVSPLQVQNPIVRSNLRTVTVRFKDSLQANTTYNINFGDAIKDVNEGNVFSNFSYSFSTGPYIDSLNFSGKVIMAETGEADTTLQVYLYQNANDSSVRTSKPKYISRLNGQGEFRFTNLPSGSFRVYALKDADGGKTYNNAAEIFGFLQGDQPVTISDSTKPVEIFAYAEVKKDNPLGAPAAGVKAPVKTTGNIKNPLRISTTSTPTQDLLKPLELDFTNPLLALPASSIRLTDSNYRPITNVTQALDSSRKKLTFNVAWQPGMDYRVVINNAGITDSLGNDLFKADTLSFTTKSQADYGKVTLRFTNVDLAKNPVLILSQGLGKQTLYPLKTNTWKDNMFPPGEYIIKVLYDENKNGVWDPGNFDQRKQPENVIAIPQKLSVRGDWDNEVDIEL